MQSSCLRGREGTGGRPGTSASGRPPGQVFDRPTREGRPERDAAMLRAMNASDSADSALPEGPRMNGRTVVYLLVICGLMTGAAATAFRLSNHGRITEAQIKALPTLLAEVVPSCERPDGMGSPLRKGESCGADATLVLAPRSRGPGTESVLYALLSEGGALVGPLKPDSPTRLALSRTTLGAQTLVLVMAGGPLPAEALEKALANAHSLAERHSALDTLVADTIAAGRFQARSERRDFVVTP